MRLTGWMLLLGVTALAGCAGPPQSATRFDTVLSARGDVRDIVPAVGEVHDEIEMAVPILGEGRVAAINVRFGQRVHKGDTLATIAPREIGDEVGNATADLEQAEIAREVARNRHAKAAAEYSRVKQLHERGFVADARLVTAQNDLEIERLNLLAAERKAGDTLARSGRVRARVAQRAALRSPCDCVVEDINLRPGQSVSPALTDAFFLTGSRRMMTIRVKVPEQDLDRVQSGTVRFQVEAAPEKTFDATLTYISNHAIKEGRFTYYPVLVQFNRDDPSIRPGMTANVEFVNADSRNVLAVPIKALYFKPRNYIPPMDKFIADVYDRARTPDERRLALAMADGAEFGALERDRKRKLFVLENGKPARRLIRVGAQTADNFEVVSGLKPGEQVILATREPG